MASGEWTAFRSRGIAWLATVTVAVWSYAGSMPYAASPGSGVPRAWDARVVVEQTGFVFTERARYASSAKLSVRWEPASGARHYQVVARSQVSGIERSVRADSSSLTLTDLESATAYDIRVIACLDESCDGRLEGSDTATGRTEAEHWQVQGTGNSFAGALKPVSDGNVGSYAFPYGEWGGESRSGRVQLYYNPTGMGEKGVKLALTDTAYTDTSRPPSFTPLSGFGLRRACGGGPPENRPPCPGSSAAAEVALFQAVPLAEAMGGLVRLFFEANGTDGKTRIMWLDSHDGYAGRDFHAGASTVCTTIQDYARGGGCDPTMAIGVEGDVVAGNVSVENARQFKIGYPTLADWRWNGEIGTFMVFTIEVPLTCSDRFFNAGYAVWDGARWVVQYGESGCPKLVPSVQAPMPVHVGGSRYKLYFQHNESPRGARTGPVSSLKPFKLMYADGARTGESGVTSFEDWDPQHLAREVVFLWPDGSELSVEDESRLDDSQMFTPTNSLDYQVMFTNMSLGMGSIPPFIGTVVLINP